MATYAQAIAAYDAGRLDDALNACEALLAERPRPWRTTQNLWQIRTLKATCLHKLGRAAEALAESETIFSACQGTPEVHFNHSLMLLFAGEFERGWREFEWRRKIPAMGTPTMPAPEWHGEDPAGKTILIVSEQGFGDCIQFARYLPLIRERADRLIFCVPPALIPLFENEPYLDLVTNTIGPDTQFDAYANVCSLALLFGATADSVPPPALAADLPASRNEEWRARTGRGQINIGIAWSGDSTLENDSRRSAELADFLSLLDVPGTHLYSLQLHAPIADAPPRLHQLGTELRDFADTAAIVRQLDLVVSVDTALAHLAASLGQRTWIVLPDVEEWRWVDHSGRHDASGPNGAVGACMWYPEARLFRQSRRGDWAGVMERVRQTLLEKGDRHAV